MSQQYLKWIQRGASVEVADAVVADPSLITWRDVQGVSALMWAIYSGQTLIRDYLLFQLAQAGGSLDVFEASAVGEAELLEEGLKRSPAHANALSGDGWTPLHLAAAFGTPETVQVLLANGASVATVSKNAQKNQPLHAALALGRNAETVRLLLEAGADPNATQTGGYTALFSAAGANRTDLVELLTAHGADPSIRNDFGQSPAELARERGYSELADRLSIVTAATKPS
ncbi:ankyrin repeat domain-containing protein [Acidicapsa ligni]|uniref:ankyrin repeat domain-containing protein n=1 Tax=Acidicapsa ligni TaxID=542300 RepID=UPI0021E07D57|nr:ankyrin repeat domain-containing protein [Acidicapsa ligni]